MEGKGIFILCCIATVALALPLQENDSKVITESKPGQEYVFVQSTGSGARPIARKDKTEDKERPFETAHKLPPGLTFALNDEDEAEEPTPVKPVKKAGKKVHKRAAAGPAKSPAPAPPGATKINIDALLKKYKEDMKTSTTEKPSSTSAASSTKSSRRRGSRRRTEREVNKEDAVSDHQAQGSSDGGFR